MIRFSKEELETRLIEELLDAHNTSAKCLDTLGSSLKLEKYTKPIEIEYHNIVVVLDYLFLCEFITEREYDSSFKKIRSIKDNLLDAIETGYKSR